MGVCLMGSTIVASALGNAPEGGQQRAQEDLVPKIDLLCGTHLRVTWDGASLRRHNLDVQRDQTDGHNECNEPLRLLWYACKSDQGRAAVRAAQIGKVLCRGTGNAMGSLTVDGGTITVERSAAETQGEKPYLRSHKQFEAALRISVAVSEDDPYDDRSWNDVAFQPNPVTSTTDYCLVNGKKVALAENERATDSMSRRQEDGTVKCWRGGQVITDVELAKGRKTGFLTETLVDGTRRSSYRDDKLDGEQTVIEHGTLHYKTRYDAGEEVWRKELYPSGKLNRYSRRLARGMADVHLAEDGRVYGMSCAPEVRDDKELRSWCGFDGKKTVQIYDGTGKVSRVVTWRDGVLQEQRGGVSDYASGSNVSFKDGKKHGEERIVDKTGKLLKTIEWNRGVQDGKEREYADDGKKVIRESRWRADVLQEVTELFLNGNPKSRETFETPDRKLMKRFWDTGKLREEGVWVSCNNGWGGRDWCPDGTFKSYFENGTPAAEESYDHGKRRGTAKTWWPDGKPQSVEEYVDDRRSKAKHWDKDGKLVLDEQYEADGSRKLR
jgi:antitoxin component YwqK of YwqJK toxin-antitoxin module